MKILFEDFSKSLKNLFRFDYYFFRYFIYISLKVKVIPDRKPIVLVSHEMSKTGAPLLLLYMVKYLAKNGWDVHVVSKLAGPLISEYAKFCRVYIVRNPKRFKSRLVALKYRGGQSVVVNSVASGDWVPPLKALGFDVVSLVHEMANVIDILGLESNANSIGKYSDIVVFPSNYVRESFLTVADIKCKSKILTQGLYLKPESYPDKRISRSNLITSYHLRDSIPIIINVATGNFRKGFDIFLDMAGRESEMEFIWVGDYDSRVYESFVKANPNADLSNLRLLGYLDSKTRLFELYSGADVLALTSREEPFGSIVLEAFSCGLPVIGFKGAGGFQDVVKTAETGWLATQCNAESMLEAIHLLVDDRALYGSISKKAKSVSKNFDFDQYVESILAFHVS
jgi:glycosyltransferase involved in cell wall biosynthesis